MLHKRDIAFLKKAGKISQASDFDRVHIGCIAVDKNISVACGFNTYKTHPMQREYDKYRDLNTSDKVSNLHAMHAEMMCLNALRGSNIRLDKVKLYIYRSMISKPFGMARPCKACMKRIKDMGIKHIYYTTDDGYAYEYLDS